MWFIFRKADRALLYQGEGESQYENELSACEANEGGPPEDYVTFRWRGPIPGGSVPTMTKRGEFFFAAAGRQFLPGFVRRMFRLR